ncbi:Uncharacterised protein [Chromobacterium violaceum]|uniref:Uncharacterized protein n=1 Tax=Chromobacterium violaceum TaxID=536 RepID=A0A3S4ICH9_CHRVL|nr:Uncharacterised protein [Chromobacterium violaceum]
MKSDASRLQTREAVALLADAARPTAATCGWAASGC